MSDKKKLEANERPPEKEEAAPAPGSALRAANSNQTTVDDTTSVVDGDLKIAKIKRAQELCDKAGESIWTKANAGVGAPMSEEEAREYLQGLIDGTLQKPSKPETDETGNDAPETDEAGGDEPGDRLTPEERAELEQLLADPDVTDWRDYSLKVRDRVDYIAETKSMQLLKKAVVDLLLLCLRDPWAGTCVAPSNQAHQGHLACALRELPLERQIEHVSDVYVEELNRRIAAHNAALDKGQSKWKSVEFVSADVAARLFLALTDVNDGANLVLYNGQAMWCDAQTHQWQPFERFDGDEIGGPLFRFFSAFGLTPTQREINTFSSSIHARLADERVDEDELRRSLTPEQRAFVENCNIVNQGTKVRNRITHELTDVTGDVLELLLPRTNLAVDFEDDGTGHEVIEPLPVLPVRTIDGRIVPWNPLDGIYRAMSPERAPEASEDAVAQLIRYFEAKPVGNRELAMPVGVKGAGKSTIVLAFTAMCGEGNFSAASLEDFDDNSVRAGLVGKAAVLCDEGGTGVTLTTQNRFVKTIADGNWIGFHQMYHGRREGRFRGPIVEASNERLRTSDRSGGMTSRTCEFPYGYSFYDDPDRSQDVETICIYDMHVLRWLIQEADRRYPVFFEFDRTNPLLAKATEEYADDIDVVRQFVKEFVPALEAVGCQTIPMALLYGLFGVWYSSNVGRGKISAKAFRTSAVPVLAELGWDVDLDDKGNYKRVRIRHWFIPEQVRDLVLERLTPARFDEQGTPVAYREADIASWVLPATCEGKLAKPVAGAARKRDAVARFEASKYTPEDDWENRKRVERDLLALDPESEATYRNYEARVDGKDARNLRDYNGHNLRLMSVREWLAKGQPSDLKAYDRIRPDETVLAEYRAQKSNNGVAYFNNHFALVHSGPMFECPYDESQVEKLLECLRQKSGADAYSLDSYKVEVAYAGLLNEMGAIDDVDAYLRDARPLGDDGCVDAAKYFTVNVVNEGLATNFRRYRRRLRPSVMTDDDGKPMEPMDFGTWFKSGQPVEVVYEEDELKDALCPFWVGAPHGERFKAGWKNEKPVDPLTLDLSGDLFRCVLDAICALEPGAYLSESEEFRNLTKKPDDDSSEKGGED